MTGDGALGTHPIPASSIPPPREDGRPYRVCFVCTGNICRSPMAEVMLRDLTAGERTGDGTLADRLEISSFGTGPWHVAEQMDPRARAALAGRGLANGGHVARQIAANQLGALDLVLALDRRHVDALRTLDDGDALSGRLLLLGELAATRDEPPDIADPFYGETADFEACLDRVEAACRGLAAALADAFLTWA